MNGNSAEIQKKFCRMTPIIRFEYYYKINLTVEAIKYNRLQQSKK